MGNARSRNVLLSAALAVMVGASASSALAQSPGPLGDAFRSRQTGAPPVARYVAEGVTEFTFDTSTGRPMVRFNGNSEIVALQPTPAPRGDVVYRNDMGDQVLRYSGMGGLTVFTSATPNGAPARMIGPADPIRLNVANAADLFLKARAAADRISRAVGKQFLIDAPDIGPESSSLVADVLGLTVTAFERVTRRPQDKAKAQALDTVLVVEGDRPAAEVHDDVLRITVAPSRGVAGRPSSAKISRALTD